MKILLAPSETKTEGGEKNFKLDSLLFKELTPTRANLLKTYQDIIDNSTLDELKVFFGIKKESEILKYRVNLQEQTAKKAIERYSGVAFDYLDYNSLNAKAVNYIDSNLILFSNLFGAIKASDYIPNYRVKQGTMLKSIKVEKLYNQELKEPLNKLLENEDILDIRAGYYNKFYKPTKNYTTLKFLKGGKVVSHWAKAYRGLVLRYCAINQVESIEEFIKLNIPQLDILEIRESKSKQEIIYEISD